MAEFFPYYLKIRKQREWRRKEGQAKEICIEGASCQPWNSVLLWVTCDSGDAEGSVSGLKLILVGILTGFSSLVGLVSETVLRIAAHVCRSHVFLSASRTAHEDRRLPSTQPPIPLSPCQAVKQISSSWWRLLTVFIGIPPLTLTTVPWSRLLSPILTDPLRLSGRG